MSEDFFSNTPESDLPTEPFITSEPPKTTNSLAITALVLGIVGILGSWIPIFNIGSIVMAILALIFGIITLSKATRENIGKGFPITGIVLGGLTLIIAILMNIFFFIGVNEFSNELTNTEQPAKISDYNDFFDDFDDFDNFDSDALATQLADMTTDEFVDYFHDFTDDYDKAAKAYQKNPDNDELFDNFLTLDSQYDLIDTRLEELEDEFSEEQKTQIDKDLKRIMESTDLFGKDELENLTA
ncbi:hypothetical protein Hs30E_08440 [Lactococcus hodotermopsidis]|uniref:DUF4190 domain-containing protein n=1 Tax=Pseudolactococcus hodotermopsidis TaxID=2709157 RepID=A0A6A0BC70_9LACT|nr:DUF4190 domain-containing protein [Lactococcus hodotermopsidis]GFH42293.1 hypothetical protein Hs30E_08440 [Lactococcus hodotermopsidis]